MWIVWLLIILILLCALYAFLLMPNLPRRPLAGLDGRHYAHRGLWDNTIPENSMPAFLNALRNGYGIELDVHLTADGQLVVFHDDTLNRMCGVDRDIHDLTMDELRSCRLMGTTNTPPTLQEVLRLVNGRVPLIVEIKTARGNTDRLCQAVRDTLYAYHGPFCIESFDPAAVKWWRVNAPSVIRGLLAHSLKEVPEGKMEARYVVMASLAHTVIARPDFIAYDFHSDRNLPMTLMRLFRPWFVAWTVRTPEELEANKGRYDLQIFEGFPAERS